MEIGLKSASKKRYGQAAQTRTWGQKAQPRRDMVNQHKHGDKVEKRKQEGIWSSVTGEIKKFEKDTKSKMASHKAHN
jgi:hypothetical protein